MNVDQATFLGMVFLAVFLLARALTVPTFGTEARAARHLRKRVKHVVAESDKRSQSLISRHKKNKSVLESWFEPFPGIEALERLLMQTGRETPAYKVLLFCFALALVAGITAGIGQAHPVAQLIAVLIAGFLPIFKLRAEREKRLKIFEEQLPDAIDVMGRALQAGHPFVDAMQLVAEEMHDPIAQEFRTTYSDINYGMQPKTAFYNLLDRVPSVSLMAMVTAILIQRETGGNLAEILSKISGVIRARFKFQRKVLSLSAEARLSAWILALIPFVLAAIMMIVAPTYLPMLKDDPQGRQLILYGFIAIVLGIFWMRKLINIKV